MFSKRKKKSYAAIFPGSLAILHENNDKPQITEHDIPKVKNGCTTKELNEMFSSIKKHLDNTIAGVIYIGFSEEHKNRLINAAKENGLQKFEIVEPYRIISMATIRHVGYDIKYLKNNKIIWTSISYNLCIWKGNTICDDLEYSFDKESFEGLLLTTIHPPDVIIYEKIYRNDKYFDENRVIELFPSCKIIYDIKIPDITNTSYLDYAKMLFEDGTNLNSKNADNVKNNFQCEKRNDLPSTSLHVGISECSNLVAGVYYLNGKEREFTFKIDASLSSIEQQNATEKALEIAAARVNGIFGCICIVVENAKMDKTLYTIKWAKEYGFRKSEVVGDIVRIEDIGFKKAEIIEKRQAEYYEVISHFNLKSSDVVWISNTYENYEILQNYTFQTDIQVKELKNKLPSRKYFPDYVIFKDQTWQYYREAELTQYFPNCIYLFFNCQHTYKTMLKYAKMMDKSNSQVSTSAVKKNADVTKNLYETPFPLIPPIETTKSISSSTKEAEKNTDENKKVKETSFQNFNEKTYTIPAQISINNDQIKVIGIDLGTSRCCAAVNRKNGITTVPLDNTGERLLPSYVAYDEENVKCGRVVVSRLRQFSKWTVFDSKRIIGRSLNDIEIDFNWPFLLSEENKKVVIEVKKCSKMVQKSAEDVASDLLKYIKRKSEEFQGTKLPSIVITVPAAFSDNQKEATIRAAKLAECENVVLLPEPIAAAFAYFIDRSIPNNSTVLVFDLGGGTLDVCLFKIENDKIQIISNTGDTKLGGRDFDNVLFNHFRNQLETKYGITLNKDKKYKLISDCQRIKEELSVVESCGLNVDDFKPDIETHEVIIISREEFQSFTKPLLNRIRNTLLSALHDSQNKSNDIQKILLVGGGSRMPMIKQLLLELFPKSEHCCEEHPDEVVAIGAAYYAYSQQISVHTNSAEIRIQQLLSNFANDEMREIPSRPPPRPRKFIYP